MKILDSFHSKTRVKGGTIDTGMYHQPATERKKYIGNAVEIHQAAALCQCLAATV